MFTVFIAYCVCLSETKKERAEYWIKFKEITKTNNLKVQLTSLQILAFPKTELMTCEMAHILVLQLDICGCNEFNLIAYLSKLPNFLLVGVYDRLLPRLCQK